MNLIPQDILIEPIVSEKSVGHMEHNKYVFKVHLNANKSEIKKAVELIFKVKVLKVNTNNMQGKKKRLGVHQGRRSHWKKAIVTLQEGNRIELFEGL